MQVLCRSDLAKTVTECYTHNAFSSEKGGGDEVDENTANRAKKSVKETALERANTRTCGEQRSSRVRLKSQAQEGEKVNVNLHFERDGVRIDKWGQQIYRPLVDIPY